MKRVFNKLFNFLNREVYQPDQTGIPVFDEVTTGSVEQPVEAIRSTQKLSRAEKWQKAKSSITELEKVIKESLKQQELL